MDPTHQAGMPSYISQTEAAILEFLPQPLLILMGSASVTCLTTKNHSTAIIVAQGTLTHFVQERTTPLEFPLWMLSPRAPQPQLHPLLPIARTTHSLCPNSGSAVSLFGCQSCCVTKFFLGRQNTFMYSLQIENSR